MDTAGLDFTEMGQQRREQLIGAANEATCVRKQLGVGDVFERRAREWGERGDGVRRHALQSTPRFSEPRRRALASFQQRNTFRVRHLAASSKAGVLSRARGKDARERQSFEQVASEPRQQDSTVMSELSENVIP